jgi:hypothetical protein
MREYKELPFSQEKLNEMAKLGYTLETTMPASLCFSNSSGWQVINSMILSREVEKPRKTTKTLDLTS